MLMYEVNKSMAFPNSKREDVGVLYALRTCSLPDSKIEKFNGKYLPFIY